MSLPFITSAPGKVIIFGEHSAVYNEPAVAASVSSLRTYLLVSQHEDPEAVELDFPDIQFKHKWSHSEFGCILKGETNSRALEMARTNTRELSQFLVESLESLHSDLKKSLFYHAAFSFSYLYICLCPQVKGVRFSIRSTLPIGAGLGSSASVSVALALAMNRLSGAITSDRELSIEDKKLVEEWSFVGEKCILGTPSGIDNAVATHGNAVLFKREMDGTTNFEFVDDFPQIPMLLTYTKIPRSTKTLVSNVRELVSKHPNIVKPILVAMGQLATRGAEILDSLSDENYHELLELVRVNHGLLVGLGVSHPGLEAVRSLSDSLEIGSTKLTGAGGGGCALTILKKDAKQSAVKQFKDTLENEHGYALYQTQLGGIGCSILPREAISDQDLKKIRILFTEDFDSKHLDQVLLPGECTLPWIT
ncbi:hypothetical protein HG536_0A08190 [Torulaspora globosa]|uniref:Mevalonate kinase n=1 Tax=Torulaspora globosa TaxID=48254 RepID=A0A7G3ZBW8_9SACH|nr:uncharacterized protein HG536_0A08190 [Torulaspora globosa]QLL31004.1 hypothetical protein HG536_0A08190 [Torulaspora globosa]